MPKHPTQEQRDHMRESAFRRGTSGAKGKRRTLAERETQRRRAREFHGTEYAKERVRSLHPSGLNDREMGKIIGVSTTTVFKLRKELDLPPNGHPGRPRKEN